MPMATTAVRIEKPDSIRRATGRDPERVEEEPAAVAEAPVPCGGSVARGVSVTLRSPTFGDGSGAGTSLVPTPDTDVTRWCCCYW